MNIFEPPYRNRILGSLISVWALLTIGFLFLHFRTGRTLALLILAVLIIYFAIVTIYVVVRTARARKAESQSSVEEENNLNGKL